MHLSTVPAYAEDATVVHIGGVLDIATAAQLRATVAHLLADGQVRIVADLAHLTYCDVAGLDVLLDARTQALAAGGFLRVARLPALPRGGWEADLSAAFILHDSIEAALEAIRIDTAGIHPAGIDTAGWAGTP